MTRRVFNREYKCKAAQFVTARLPPDRRAVGMQRNDHEPQEAVSPLL